MASLSKVFAVSVLVVGLGAIGFVGYQYYQMSGDLASTESAALSEATDVADAASAVVVADAKPKKKSFFDRFKSKDTEVADVPPEEVLTMECNQRGARKSCSVVRETEEE
ncbi:hypothetical protein [Celeribacter sp.]|uniref:hypothetical protein n=1 Tax=Celeribacter sp. TaxID=1890673 RepID=UPI003A92B9AC